MKKKHIISMISIYIVGVLLGLNNFTKSFAAPPIGMGQFAPDDAFYLLTQPNPSLPNASIFSSNNNQLFKSVGQVGITCGPLPIILPGSSFILPANLLGNSKGLRITGVFNVTPVGTQDSVTFRLKIGSTNLLERGFGTDENTIGTYPFETILYNNNSATSQITYSIMQLKNYTPYPQPAGMAIISQHTAIDTTINQNLITECEDGGDDVINLDFFTVELLP